MRTRLTEYKYIILAVLISAGVSIAAWAFAFYYDNPRSSAIAQKEAQNDSQTARVMPLELDHRKLILLLVCTGLIGFFGVRRQNDPLRKFVKDKHPHINLRVNLRNDRNSKRRDCQLWETGCAAS